MRRLMILMAAVLVVGCTRAAAPTAVPKGPPVLGEADATLGQLHLGMTRADVQALYPNAHEDRDGYGNPEMAEGNWHVTFRDGEPGAWKVLVSPGVTPRGLRTGDSLDRAKELYGEPRRISDTAAVWVGQGVRLGAILDHQTIVSLFIAMAADTPVPTEVKTAQDAIDAVFVVDEADDGWSWFPRQPGAQDGRFPIGGPFGTTLPGRFETEASALGDGRFEVRFTMRWTWNNKPQAATATYRVSKDGTVQFVGEEGDRTPAIK